MDHRNESPRSGRGRETAAVCWDSKNYITTATLDDALHAACVAVGIVDRDVPADGRWHKTDIDGDPRGRGDGRIKQHENVCLRDFILLVCIVSLPLVKYRRGEPDVDAFLEAHTIDSAQG
jgi:hypothetical protein